MRFTRKRKAAILRLLELGGLSYDEALQRYNLAQPEINEWKNDDRIPIEWYLTSVKQSVKHL